MKLRTKLTLTSTVIVIFAVFVSTFFVITFTIQKTIDEITTSGISDFEEFYISFISDSELNTRLRKADRLAYSYLRYRFYNTSGHDEYVLQKGDAVMSNNTG